MKNAIHTNRVWLDHQYSKLRKTWTEIALDCDRNQSTLSYWRKKFKILSRTRSEAHHMSTGNHLVLTKETLELLNGLLLGDGSLKNKKWAVLYSHTSKYNSFLKYISNELANHGIEQAGKINSYRRQGHFQGKFANRFYTSFHYNSKYYVELKLLYSKWYIPNSENKRPKFIKIIPLDLELTPLVCQQWYLGDGSLHKTQKYIVFCTQGFSSEGVDYLVNLLKKQGINSTMHKTRKIQISRKSVSDFFDYIGSCPIAIKQIYGYKWKY